MKRLHPLLRGAVYLLGGVLILWLGLYIYLGIPRPLGEIRVHRIGVVSGRVMDRLGEVYMHEDDRPARMLRIELSSGTDLLARAFAVSGSGNPLYAWSGPCPFQAPYGKAGTTRGPYPDDMPEFSGDNADYRHAQRQADSRFHYTVYVDANGIEAMTQGLCLKIVGSWYFSPHAASDVIAIPQEDIQKALRLPIGGSNSAAQDRRQ